ncbi:MAG: hypothetical protein LBT66_01905 [Methanobrevibacter sp.]|jgi:hypothetical protein|nr:hypothetical protein [Candidatus Methanovirga meridionalis]
MKILKKKMKILKKGNLKFIKSLKTALDNLVFNTPRRGIDNRTHKEVILFEKQISKILNR